MSRAPDLATAHPPGTQTQPLSPVETLVTENPEGTGKKAPRDREKERQRERPRENEDGGNTVKRL